MSRRVTPSRGAFVVAILVLDGASAQGCLSGGLAVTGGNLYWTENGVPWRLSTAGGTPMTITIPQSNNAQASGQVAVDATSMYWVVVVSGARILMKCDLNFQTPLTLASAGTLGGPSSAVIDGNAIYWTGMGVMRAGLGGEAPTPIASDLNLTNGIAVDATSVYVATTSGQVLKIEK